MSIQWVALLSIELSPVSVQGTILGPPAMSSTLTCNCCLLPVGDCKKPAPPLGGSIQEYTDFDELFYKRCRPQCPNGTAFLRPVPNFYSCGPLGVWNTTHPLSKLRFPPCGSECLYHTALSLHSYWQKWPASGYIHTDDVPKSSHLPFNKCDVNLNSFCNCLRIFCDCCKLHKMSPTNRWMVYIARNNHRDTILLTNF